MTNLGGLIINQLCWWSMVTSISPGEGVNHLPVPMSAFPVFYKFRPQEHLCDDQLKTINASGYQG